MDENKFRLNSFKSERS